MINYYIEPQKMRRRKFKRRGAGIVQSILHAAGIIAASLAASWMLYKSIELLLTNK